MPKDLRKLIKYEATLGINVHQDNYFEKLFKRTTASFRAKVGKENVPSERVVNERSKRDHDQHGRRPLTYSAQQQQVNAREEMAKKGARPKFAPTPHYATNSENNGLPLSGNGRQQPQKQTRSGRSENTRGMQNLSREKAWQSNKRKPFGECNEPRGPQSDETTERGSMRASKTGAAIVREFSPKTGEAPRSTSGVRTGRRKEAETTTRDGDIQRKQAAAVRDASRGRARVRHPVHERGATTRSPSAGSYTTARSLGVIIPRHCTATRRRRPLSTDPVALYHYYQSEWNYFREQIPGESSHADLRWIIRARLMDPN